MEGSSGVEAKLDAKVENPGKVRTARGVIGGALIRLRSGGLIILLIRHAWRRVNLLY